MASSSSPKGCEMQQSIDKNNNNLEEFVKYFVKEFETKLTAYHLILEGEKKEKRESSNTFSEAVGQAAGGLAGGIVGYFAGAIGAGISAGTAAGGRVGSIVGNEMHLKKVIKLTDVVDLFLKDKAGFRIKLVEAGYDIFQSFEMQFNRVSVDHRPRKAFQLLARDAMNRVIDYFKKNKDASVTEGVVFGKSKTEPVLGFPIPKTPGFKIYYEYKDYNHEWSTSSLYEKVGLVIEAKDSSETAIYSEKKNGKSRTKKYGYRRLFTSESWETMKEEYVTLNVKKSEQFTGYQYILKSEDLEEKINDILNQINLHDSTLEGERLTEIMREVKGEIEEVINVLKEKITQSEEDRKILESIEAGVRNLKVNDFLKQFELYSKQAREEHLEIAKYIKASREENEKHYDQLNEKQDIHHDDNKREHEKTQDGIQRVKQGLDSSGKKIDEIHKVIVPQQNLKKESNWFDIRKPVQQFTGRKEELSGLHDKIQRSSGKVTVISQMTSISGLGGIGKTELARQYVHEHQEDYDDVIWINAENEDTLRESFMRLAKDYLGINTKNTGGAAKDDKSIVNEVYTFFDKGRSLFVFDNAEVDNYLYQFLPLHCTKANAKIPYILFTSRIREWEKGIQVILLNELTPDDAMEFIKNGLGINDASQDKEIKELVEKLQYFPLAIQQAISYIEDQMKTSEYGISDYLKEYETRSGILLKSQVFQGIVNDYTKTTVTTWNITLDKIENDKELGQLAVKILYIMAYLSPEKIIRKLFLNLANYNEELLASVVRLLVKYSMVNGEQQQSVLSIHRLVQEIIRLELKRQGREKENLREAFKLINQNLDEEILEHAYSLQKHLRKNEELDKESMILLHNTFYLKLSKTTSPLCSLDLPYKLRTNLLTISTHVGQEPSLKAYFYYWKELFIIMEKMFGLYMNVGEIEIQHAWKFDPFKRDKDVRGMNPQVLKRRNRGAVLFQMQSKGSAIFESVHHEDETYGNTPLHLATTKGHLDTIKYLIDDKDADVNVKNRFQCTPLHLAAQNGHLNVVKYLIDEKRADFEAENVFGQNTLHFAAANGHLDVVKYLIDQKSAGFDVPDYYNVTPLYLAAWKGKLNVIKYLVDEKGAKIDYFDGRPFDLIRLGDTNLSINRRKYTPHHVDALFKLHATTSMHLAALRGHLDTLRYFIDVKGADSNAKNIFGSTPLHSASLNGQLKTVEYLVDEKGGNVNVKNAFHSTPVHLAAQNGHLETLKYLIDNEKAHFDIENQLSTCPVHIAAQYGHLDVLKYLIDDRNARFDVVDFERNTLLHLAALNGHLATVEYLIDEKNVNVNIINADKNTPLHLAALNGHLNTVRYLIHKKHADINVKNISHGTPVSMASLNGHLNTLRYIIDEVHADFQDEDNVGQTCIHLASKNGHLDIIKYLVDEKGINVNVRDALGLAPLVLAAKYGHIDVVKYLIEIKNTDLTACDIDGNTTLHVAAKRGYVNIAKSLLQNAGEILDRKNLMGETAFHLAIRYGHADIIELILGKKANPNL